MKWLDKAPSNIALIKYMGKIDASVNLPTNASISYTLNELLSFVELEATDAGQDSWQAIARDDCDLLALSDTGQQRFIKHLNFLKQQFNYQGHFIIRSGNNFPANCGLASSAASFAALTRVACTALAELTQRELPKITKMAQLSRKGSGSSCRSFYSPWCLWREDTVETVELPYPELLHQVVVVGAAAKEVATSAAHLRVPSSSLFNGRIARAEARLDNLLTAFEQQDWRQAYHITWQEFWDMHALFETAEPPFGYFTADTFAVLEQMRRVWQDHKDGPLVTMDAGPNVHLLWRPDQQALAQQTRQQLKEHYHVL